MDHETLSKLEEIDGILRQGYAIEATAQNCGVPIEVVQSRWEELNKLGLIPKINFDFEAAE